MSPPEFVLRFPQFALTRGERGFCFVRFNLPEPYDSHAPCCPMFSSEANALKFLEHTQLAYELTPYRDPRAFRDVLDRLSQKKAIVLFDFLPNAEGILAAYYACPAIEVNERYMPDRSGLVWDYPVYVVTSPLGIMCPEAESDGKKTKALFVYTDLDLAERGVAQLPPGHVPMPLANADQFLMILSGAHDVETVIFDPPAARLGEPKVYKMCMDRKLVITKIRRGD